MSDSAYIYGFLSRGKFLYVGSTINPPQRRRNHVGERKGLKASEFVVLGSVPKSSRYAAEYTVIRALKAVGQCRFNKNRGRAVDFLPTKRLNVRLPAGLHKQLVKELKSQGLTIQDWIVNHVTRDTARMK